MKRCTLQRVKESLSFDQRIWWLKKNHKQQQLFLRGRKKKKAEGQRHKTDTESNVKKRGGGRFETRELQDSGPESRLMEMSKWWAYVPSCSKTLMMMMMINGFFGPKRNDVLES